MAYDPIATILTQIPNALNIQQTSTTPTTVPASGFALLYVKPDNNLYSLNSRNVESQFLSSTTLSSATTPAGSTYIGDNNSYSNFTPVSATVKGGLSGIDTELGAINAILAGGSFVPYTGADADLNLGSNNFSANQGTFNDDTSIGGVLTLIGNTAELLLNNQTGQTNINFTQYGVITSQIESAYIGIYGSSNGAAAIFNGSTSTEGSLPAGILFFTGAAQAYTSMTIDNTGLVTVGPNSFAGTHIVNGSLNVSATTITNAFQLTTSPTAGYVLTSDSSGNGTWQHISGGITGPGSSIATSIPTFTDTSGSILQSSGLKLTAPGTANAFFSSANTSVTGTHNFVGGGGSAAQYLTTGSYNILLGQQAGQYMTTGNYVVAIGYQALSSLAAPYADIAIGYQALNLLSSETGNPLSVSIGNIAIGQGAYETMTNGDGNVGMGLGTGYGGITGIYNNTTLGMWSGSDTTSGTQYNASVGAYALSGSSGSHADYIGVNNSVLGALAMSKLGSSGSAITIADNVAVGFSAAALYQSYTESIFIGSGADAASTGLTNAIAIGYQAIAPASNTFQLGNSSTAGVYTSGTYYSGGTLVPILSSPTTYGVAYASSASALSTTAAGTAGFVLVANSASAPTFQQLDLSNGSNTFDNQLPVNLGGTNRSSVATIPANSAWAGWDSTAAMNAEVFKCSNTPQITLTGSAGSAICSQPFQGAASNFYQKVVIYLNGYTDTGTQTYTFPTAFSHTPYVYGLTSGVAGATVSTTSITFTVTTLTGFVFLEGY